MSAKKLEVLLEDSASTERSVGQDEVILRQGEGGDSIYVIGSGSVEAILDPGDGTPISLAVLGRGEVFGEIALIAGRPRSATVRAKEHSIVLELHGPRFRDLMWTIIPTSRSACSSRSGSDCSMPTSWS